MEDALGWAWEARSVTQSMGGLGICGAEVVDTIPSGPLAAWGALVRGQAVFAVPSHADKAIRRPQNTILARFAWMHEGQWGRTRDFRTFESVAQLSWRTIRIVILALGRRW
jgi:hypothetical protein